jgi:hypothetical protein
MGRDGRGTWWLGTVGCALLGCAMVAVAASRAPRVDGRPAVSAALYSDETCDFHAWVLWSAARLYADCPGSIARTYEGCVISVTGTVGRWEREGTSATMYFAEAPVRCELGAGQGRALSFRPGTRVRVIGTYSQPGAEPTLVGCSVRPDR